MGVLFKTGHKNSVVGVDFTPDGKYMASRDFSNMILIWETRTQYEIASIDARKYMLEDIKFAPSGNHLIGVGRYVDTTKYKKQGAIVFWDHTTGKEIKVIDVDDRIRFMVINGKGDMYTLDNKATIDIWNPETGEFLQKQRLGGLIPTPSNFSISPCGRYMAFGISGGPTYAGKIATDILVSSVGGKSKKGFLVIRDLQENKLVKEIHLGVMDKEYNRFPMKLSFSKDGSKVICGGRFADGKNIKIYDMETKKIIRSADTKYSVTAMDISPDGKFIYTSTRSGQKIIDIWDGETLKHLKSFPLENPVSEIIFDPSQTYFVTTGGNIFDKTWMIHLWDYKTETKIGEFQSIFSVMSDVLYNEPKKELIIASEDGNILFLNMETGIVNKSFEFGRGEVTVNMDPSKRFLICSFTDRTRFVPGKLLSINYVQGTLIYDINSHELIDSLPGYGQAIFSNDNKFATFVNKRGFNTYIKTINMENNKQVLDERKLLVGTIFGFDNSGQHILTTKAKLTKFSFAVYNINSLKKPVFKPKNMAESKGMSLTDAVFGEDHTKVIVSVGNRRRFNSEINLVDAKENRIIKNIYSTTNAYAGRIYKGSNPEFLYFLEEYPDYSNTLKRINLATYEVDREYANKGLAMANDSQDKYFFTTAVDNNKVLNIVDMENDEFLMHILKVSDSDECLIYTPENYYMSGKNAHKHIAFIKDGRTYPFEQFDLFYNRPDIVAKSLPQSNPMLVKQYESAVNKRQQQLGFQSVKTQADYDIPEIEIVGKDNLSLFTHEKTFSFDFIVTNSNKYLDRYNIWINDVPIYGKTGISLKDKKIKDFNKNASIELSNGLNKVQVSVTNIDGVESIKETFMLTYSGEQSKKDLYIYSIGVSKYANPDLNLSYASKDAGDIAEAFTTNRDAYNEIHKNIYLDEEFSKKTLNSIKQELMKTKVDDRVIIFYAGHGFLDDNFNYYLATSQIKPENIADGGISFFEIESVLDGIPAREKILFIDACHSGETDGETNVIVNDNSDLKVNIRGFKKVADKTGSSEFNTFATMKLLFNDLDKATGTTIIAASGGSEFALESPEWNNGVFTYCVINGLNNKDSDKNGDNKIQISELREYVATEVVRLTAGLQNPNARKTNLFNDFDVLINMK